MASYRPRGGHGPPEHSYRSYPTQHREDFYEDRSRSRSPNRRYSSPHRRRSPPHDIPRGPRGSDRDATYNNYNDKSPDRWRDGSRDRNDYRRSSPSPRRGRGYYDRDRPSDRRSQSRSPSSERPPSRGRPSKEIILEGLAAHLTENDITNELKHHYHVDGLDDVRVIRDRQTKQSRQFGFLRFSTLDEAQSFMDQHYPFIYLYGDSNGLNGDSDDAKVRINFGRERKENRPENDDWICVACNINNYSTRLRCFRCQAPRPDISGISAPKPMNVGDNDASPDNVPSQFLLLRGLEPSVSEEIFAKGVAKLNKPSGSASQATTTSSKKGAKVASTTGDANLGAKEGTLRRVLLVRGRRNNESWRYGFAEYASIEDAQAALIRYNSFDRFTIASKQVLVSYIHAGVFVPNLNPTPATERFTFSPFGNPAIKLAYWDEEAYVTELVLSAPELPSTSSKVTSSSAAEVEGVKNVKDLEKAKKRKAQPEPTVPGAKKAASHLQFWSNRHAELHGIGNNKARLSGSDAGDDSAVAPTQSYADPVRNCCYLCMRQFENSAEVNKHERLSQLHRDNLRDDVKVTKATAKMEKHGVVPRQQESTMEYRDRAKERRKVYGVVNKKGEQVNNKSKAFMQSSDDEDKAPVQSKGAALLSKMGYTAGQGLGASGEGITAPINQNVYAAGVGLGAQGGKMGDAVTEAEKNTKGDYSAFAESVKQGARERYAKM